MIVRRAASDHAARVSVTSGTVDINALVNAWMPTPKQLQLAVAAALRKTMQWARALAVRELRQDIGVPAALLRSRITVYPSKGKNGRTRLFFGLRPIPAATLDPKQTREGVRVKGGGVVSGAFIVDMGMYDAVFKRAGAERHPLEYQRIRFHQQAERIIKGEIMPQWQKVFLKHLERELKWRTR